jgi:hypothetical protein
MIAKESFVVWRTLPAFAAFSIATGFSILARSDAAAADAALTLEIHSSGVEINRGTVPHAI